MTPPRALQPCASLPQGLCAAGANPSFPSPYSRHSSTAGDRTAPRREAVSGVLRQRRCNCAGPWVESEMEELLPELPLLPSLSPLAPPWAVCAHLALGDLQHFSV